MRNVRITGPVHLLPIAYKTIYKILNQETQMNCNTGNDEVQHYHPFNYYQNWYHPPTNYCNFGISPLYSPQQFSNQYDQEELQYGPPQELNSSDAVEN
jgi:hypothetical protein